MSLRDVVIFFAGAEAFHTLSHLLLAYVFKFPLDLNFIVLTATMNLWAIVFNGLITLALLWWASRLPK